MTALAPAPRTDFVFRETEDGTLEMIGDFDGLYRAERDPWQQSGAGDRAGYYAGSRRALLGTLRRRLEGVAHKGLEVGCGHGHALAQLARGLRAWRTHWVGIDISDAAIAQARKNYRDLDLRVGDITADPLPGTICGPFDVIVLNQVLWYVLHRFERTLQNCHGQLAPGGMLLISQAFLPPGTQRYGLDVADGFPGLMHTMLSRYGDRFGLVEARFDDTERHPYHDGLLVFRRI